MLDEMLSLSKSFIHEEIHEEESSQSFIHNFTGNVSSLFNSYGGVSVNRGNAIPIRSSPIARPIAIRLPPHIDHAM